MLPRGMSSERAAYPSARSSAKAIQGAKAEITPILVENVDPRTMSVDRRTAGLVGQAMQGRIQRSITTLQAAWRTPLALLRLRAVQIR